jgi:hypothetical protein
VDDIHEGEGATIRLMGQRGTLQRIPVGIHLDTAPPDLRLVAGQTASIQIEPSATPRTP